MASPDTQAAGSHQKMRCADWTLNIENLGKIKSASIAMAPFVILVGKNNTGKSYAASVIWALLNSQQTLFRRGIPRIQSPKWFQDLFDISRARSGTSEIQIDSSYASELEGLLNSRLQEDSGRLVRELFSYPSMTPPVISVTLSETLFPIRVAVRIVKEPEPSGLFRAYRSDGRTFVSRIFPPLEDSFASFSNVFFAFLMDGILTGERARLGSVIYIPAARTGLMLAYRFIVSQLIETLGIDALDARSNLPLPTIRFLQTLTEKRSAADPKISSIGEDLERTILGGNVVSSEQQVPDFSYVPESTKVALPLHVTSSMVTELAPFLLLLKAGQGQRGIVFEEPEAHLHLAAQRTMARALAKLVNAGVQVVVTTHSDTFLQQINNLMQLHDHPDRDNLLAGFNYIQDDVINPAKAKGYEFINTSEGTIVNELVKRPEGFVVPSLNETLEALAVETFKVQEYEDGVGGVGSGNDD